MRRRKMAFFGRSGRWVPDPDIVLMGLLLAAISIFLFGMVNWKGEQEVVTVVCSNPAGLWTVEMRLSKDHTTLSHDGFRYRNNRTGTTIVYNSAPGEMCVLLPIEGTQSAGGVTHEQDYIGDKAE